MRCGNKERAAAGRAVPCARPCVARRPAGRPALDRGLAGGPFPARLPLPSILVAAVRPHARSRAQASCIRRPAPRRNATLRRPPPILRTAVQERPSYFRLEPSCAGRRPSSGPLRAPCSCMPICRGGCRATIFTVYAGAASRRPGGIAGPERTGRAAPGAARCRAVAGASRMQIAPILESVRRRLTAPVRLGGLPHRARGRGFRDERGFRQPRAGADAGRAASSPPPTAARQQAPPSGSPSTWYISPLLNPYSGSTSLPQSGHFSTRGLILCASEL